jgi:tetratricopeptide (TPR) repeat protein
MFDSIASVARAALAGGVLTLVFAGGAAAYSPPLQTLLDRVPADSLVRPLERFERFHRNAAEAGEASLVLGQLHFARGEYRQAADAFMRAAARLDPARKAEAHYWAGLAWLGTGDGSQAHAALDAAARPGSPRRAEALFANATTWERERRPERAFDALGELLRGDPGVMGAAALERVAALAPVVHHDEEAARARDRLAREYPHSIEALRLSAAAAPPAAEVAHVPAPGPVATPPAARAPVALPHASPGSITGAPAVRPPPFGAGPAGPFVLQIGAFSDLVRARALADAARRAGYTPVRVTSLGDPAVNLYVVRVGLYRTPETARQAGAQAARVLDVPWRVIPAP